MTTYTSFISTVAGITITGVTKKHAYIPVKVSTASLPASFVRLPGGGINGETLTTCADDGKSRTVELVVILEPMGQQRPSKNFSLTVTMMDNMETALDALGDFMPMVSYEIRAEGVAVGDAVHWGIIATITGIE